MRKIKIYGERNTGTNYLERLISKNLETPLLKYIPNRFISVFLKFEFQTDLLLYLNRKKHFGWKHGVPYVDVLSSSKNRPYIICLVKNPYAFLVSLFRKPYHYQGVLPTEFDDFVKKPWRCIHRDNMSRKLLINPVELWNEKTKSIRDLSLKFPDDTLLIRYETLLDNPKTSVDLIAKKFNLKYLDKDFTNIIASTKKADYNYHEYKDYYLNERWSACFNPSLIEFVNDKLDHRLMKDLSYNMLNYRTI